THSAVNGQVFFDVTTNSDGQSVTFPRWLSSQYVSLELYKTTITHKLPGSALCATGCCSEDVF
ncbi:hypothetical protein, partial [Streptococcus pyogenes]|uniref:hypothetical protein n=1 Tax=Streptococcus pyogenes TaxID=1314 RepID=UPI003DA16C3A